MRVLALPLLGACAACSTVVSNQPSDGLAATMPPAVMPPAVMPPASAQNVGRAEWRKDNAYTAVQVGMWLPGGDLRDLDQGLAANLIIGRDLLPGVSVEVEVGYLDAEGRLRGNQFSMYALPMFLNWRFRLPVQIVKPYIGAGLGALYADYESVGRYSTTEYLFAWNAFGGVEVEVGSVAFGAEYKYVQAEESDKTIDLFTIEGQSLTAFLSLRF